MKKLLCGALLAIWAFPLWAGGFQVNLGGVKQTGMGHVGAGLALDASTMFFNPGALGFVKDRNFHVGANGIIARVTYREPEPGTYTSATEPGLSTPFAAYGSWFFGKKKNITIGAGVYTPFGSRVLYPDDWKGQFMLREISLQTFFIQPTVAWKINKYVSIGAGAVIATGSVTLRKAIPAQFDDESYGEANLSGSGMGYGFNAGVMVRPIKALSVGLSYRSTVGFKAKKGDAVFTVPESLAEYFPTTTFSSNIKLPWTATLGLGYRINDKILIATDINYVGWAVYDTLSFDFADNTEKLADQNSPREYTNAFIFRLGGEYSFNRFIQIRLGTYLDMTPVSNGYITPETPDAHKIGISGGASFRLGKYVQLDAAFLFVEGMERTASNYENSFSGTFKARAFIPSFGINILIPERNTTEELLNRQPEEVD